MQTRNISVDNYIKRIRKEAYRLASIDDYLDELRIELYAYAKDNPECTEHELEEVFGSPADIAQEWLDTKGLLDPKRLFNSRIKTNIVIGILVVLAAGLLIYQLIPKNIIL